MSGAWRSAARAPGDPVRLVLHVAFDHAHVWYEANRPDHPLIVDDQHADLLGDFHTRTLFESRRRTQKVQRLQEVRIGWLFAGGATGRVPLSVQWPRKWF